jgi:hypothetical protein
MSEHTEMPPNIGNLPHPLDKAILQDLGPLIQASVSKISDVLSKFIEDNFGGPEQFRKTLLKVTQNAALFIEALPAMEKRLKAAEKSVFEGLLDYSWFFDPEMDTEAFFALAALIDGKEEGAINQTMIEHFRGRLDAIESDLCAKQEKRTPILTKAFKAHREQHYALAIPVLLAQADGVSRDLIGVEYFVALKYRDRVEALVQEVAGDFFLEAALRALLPVGAMRMPSSKKKDGSFNRHAIIHGVDVDYDNELNSLKAVSLLNFMSRMNDSKRERQLSKTH